MKCEICNTNLLFLGESKETIDLFKEILSEDFCPFCCNSIYTPDYTYTDKEYMHQNAIEGLTPPAPNYDDI